MVVIVSVSVVNNNLTLFSNNEYCFTAKCGNVV